MLLKTYTVSDIVCYLCLLNSSGHILSPPQAALLLTVVDPKSLRFTCDEEYHEDTAITTMHRPITTVILDFTNRRGVFGAILPCCLFCSEPIEVSTTQHTPASSCAAHLERVQPERDGNNRPYIKHRYSNSKRLRMRAQIYAPRSVELSEF